jgi:hypothetical protein
VLCSCFTSIRLHRGLSPPSCRTCPTHRTRRCRGLFRPSDAFFQLQFSADYTITMFGLDFRQGQGADGQDVSCSN